MTLSIKTLRRNARRDRRARQRQAASEDQPPGALPSIRPMDGQRIVQDNIKHMGDGGVSQNNQDEGFRAAFRDDATGTVALARFEDGSPAPVHVLDGLPADWIMERDEAGRVKTVKPTVVGGFVRQGRFYTREEAAAALA